MFPVLALRFDARRQLSGVAREAPQAFPVSVLIVVPVAWKRDRNPIASSRYISRQSYT